MAVVIRECKVHGECNHYHHKDSGRLRCMKCNTEAVQKRRDNLKLMAIKYKGGKCEECGYDKCVGALEFHHVDPTQKDFGISHNGYTRSFEKVKVELDKCVMLCANCHRELHEKLRQS